MLGGIINIKESFSFHCYFYEGIQLTHADFIFPRSRGRKQIRHEYVGIFSLSHFAKYYKSLLYALILMTIVKSYEALTIPDICDLSLIRQAMDVSLLN